MSRFLGLIDVTQKHLYVAKWDKTFSIRWIVYTIESRKHTQMQQNKQLKAKWLFHYFALWKQNYEKNLSNS